MERVLDPAQAPPDVVAPLVPEWLGIEAEYANEKYGDDNVMLSALEGGLQRGGMAFNEFSSYFTSRYLVWRCYRDGNQLSADDQETLELKMSQALGKYTSSGRALFRVMVEQRDDCDRFTADETVIEQIKEGVPHMANTAIWSPEKQLALHMHGVLPLIDGINDRVEQQDWQTAARWANSLVAVQAKLFVGYSCEVGLIAQPGISSSAEAIGHWER
jgi:hypothetical protein